MQGSAVAAFGAALGGWAWIILGVVLLGLEILAPGTFMLWFGLAAIATGAVALGFDLAGSAALGWQAEVVVFLVLSLVAVFGGRRLFRGRAEPADDEGLNRRAARCIGRETTLADPIVDGAGRIRLDDTTWRVSGPDLPVGVRVRVVGADGPRLVVAAADGG